jgi:flagellar motor switch protein FliM
MQREVNVAVAFVDQATYAECIQSLFNPSCACRFTMQSGNNQAVLDMGWPVVSALLNPSSGTGKDIREGDRSPLEPGEIVTMNGTTQRLLKDLESVFGSIRMTDAELEFSPPSLRIADAGETCVIVCFEVNPDVKPEEIDDQRERRVLTQEEIDSFLDAPSKGPGHGVVT